MAMQYGSKKDSIYLMDNETMDRLNKLASDLQSGNDEKRDIGHKLSLLLDDAVKYRGDDIFLT